jgi:PD-(D/E)XK nuclease superfamily
MLIVGFSRLKSWRRCHRLYNYKYEQGLKRKRPKVQLIRGTILHALLDADALGKPVAPVLAKFKKEFGKLFLEEQDEYGDLLGDCERIFTNYKRTYAGEKYKVIGSEIELKVSLGGGVEFQGHIDKIWQDVKRRLWLVDHKSHKNIPGEEQRFSDLQTVFYTWAYNLLHPKTPVDGVIWDYLRTKNPTVPEVLKNGTLSKRENIDTDYLTAHAAVQAHLKSLPKTVIDVSHNYDDWLEMIKKKENRFFKRVHLPSPPAVMVEQIVNEMKTTAFQMLRDKGDDTRNMTRDCSWCEFYALCHAELRGQDAAYLRKAEFKIDEELLNADQEDED